MPFWFSIKKSTVRAPVYMYSAGTSFSAPQSIAGKPMEVYYLDKWIIIITLHVAGFAYIQQYLNTSITVLTNQFWKLLIALFKVPNTGIDDVLFLMSTHCCTMPQWYATCGIQESGAKRAEWVPLRYTVVHKNAWMLSVSPRHGTVQSAQFASKSTWTQP